MTATWQPATTFGGVIDVSDNNGAIDWNLVADSGIALAMIKATQGSGHVDPLFAQHRKGAEANGILVVPYHFLDESPPAAQLANFYKTADLVPGMAAAIDWEPVPPQLIRPTIATMEAMGRALATLIQRAPLAYHGMYDLASPTINTWPWWLPKYGAAPKGPKWLFWQDRPNLVVPGIEHLTDHSLFAGTLDELKAWHKTGALPAGFG